MFDEFGLKKFFQIGAGLTTDDLATALGNVCENGKIGVKIGKILLNSYSGIAKHGTSFIIGYAAKMNKVALAQFLLTEFPNDLKIEYRGLLKACQSGNKEIAHHISKFYFPKCLPLRRVFLEGSN